MGTLGKLREENKFGPLAELPWTPLLYVTCLIGCKDCLLAIWQVGFARVQTVSCAGG